MSRLNLASAFNAFTTAVASLDPAAVSGAASSLGSAIQNNSAAINQAQALFGMYTTAVKEKDAATEGSAKIALIGLESQLPNSFNAAFAAMIDPAIMADPAQFAIEGHQAVAALAAANSTSLLGSLFSRF
jgi:hypothetical protein